MGALDTIVRSGRALYAGISSYSAEQTRQAAGVMRQLGTPLLIHQPSYNMLDRWVEAGLLDVLAEEGTGCIVFSPLAQGLLTDRYLETIPEDSRAAKPGTALSNEDVSEAAIAKVRRLNVIARQRGQSMAQMSIAWVLRNPTVTSALIGASRPEQVDDAVGAIQNLDFSSEELSAIEAILGAG
jgi:L-glyceraldehyde 3-phosphate reductase